MSLARLFQYNKHMQAVIFHITIYSLLFNIKVVSNICTNINKTFFLPKLTPFNANLLLINHHYLVEEREKTKE